jgi:hypothetical protein
MERLPQEHPLNITSNNRNLARIEFPAKEGKPAYEINPAMTFGVDIPTMTMTYRAEVPNGMWLAIGWGWHMFDVDMFLMQAYPDIRRSLTSDLWSTHNVTPFYDDFDNYFDVKIFFDPERPTVQIFEFKR